MAVKELCKATLRASLKKAKSQQQVNLEASTVLENVTASYLNTFGDNYRDTLPYKRRERQIATLQMYAAYYGFKASFIRKLL